jgi:Carboxyl transferase domain
MPSLLGGILVSVVITENRTAEYVKPADPADVKASGAIVQEAGCVWFPNSAYKTAQTINDFRIIDLPLIVFTNWRGFSGCQRDMFDEVLKYGSLIEGGTATGKRLSIAGSTIALWTIQDYLSGDLELVNSNRGAGGRQVVLIANDITLKTPTKGGL